MFEAIIIQGLFKLTIAIIGVVIARLTLVWMDRFYIDSKFNKWLEATSDENKISYYGYRLIAVMLLVGLALS